MEVTISKHAFNKIKNLDPSDIHKIIVVLDLLQEHTIEHLVKGKSISELSYSEELPNSVVVRHEDVALVYRVDEESDLITVLSVFKFPDKERFDAAWLASISRGSWQPVDTAQSVLAIFADLPGRIVKKLREAYAARDRANEIRDLSSKIDAYREAEEAFAAIQKEEAKFIASQRTDAHKFRYYLRMERAYCLLNIGGEDDLKEAIAIYEEIEREYDDDAVSRYRHGRALSRLQDDEGALEMYQEGLERLSRDERLDPKHWIRSALPLNMGYAYWMISERQPPTTNGKTKALQLLENAYDVTEQGLLETSPKSDEELRIINNLIYYAFRYLKLGGRPKGAKPVISKKKFKYYLRKLEERTDISSSTDIHKLDTLVRAYIFLGHRQKASRAAERIFSVVRSAALERAGVEWTDHASLTEFLSPDEFERLEFSLSVVLRYRHGRQARAS